MITLAVNDKPRQQIEDGGNSRPHPPWGVGEPAAAVVPSAISNAVRDAVGARLRSVPFTPDRFEAAARA